MENPVLKEAKDALDRLSADPHARIRAEQREMALFSHDLGLSAARRQGIEQGRVEGIEQGRLEVLRRQLAIKFGSVPAEVLARMASATEEDLSNWLDRVLSATTLQSVFDQPET
jgi:hypothetical protein